MTLSDNESNNNNNKWILCLILSSVNILILIGCLIIFFIKTLNICLSVKFNDFVPIIVAIITLLGIIPTYVINKKKDREKMALDLEKDRTLQRNNENRELLLKLVPYIMTKRNHSNCKLYYDYDPEFENIINKYPNKDFYNSEEIRNAIFTHCQSKISDLTFYLTLFASNELIDSLYRFNRAKPDPEKNKNNKKEYEELMNAIRSEFGYEEIDFTYGKEKHK